MENNQGVSIHMGFPNPAADTTLEGLNLHTLLIKNPSSTFLMRIDGNEWEDRGVYNQDILIVDRALTPSKNDLVIVTKDSDILLARNTKLPEDALFWGTVRATIHQRQP